MKSNCAALAATAFVGVALVAFAAEPKKPADKKAPPPALPKPPAEAIRHLKVADDLRLDQVLAEPVVAQPIFLNFDARGRMWVIQYLQYPFPAGLKILSEDKHLRATYDKVPPPPPNHFKGRDKITIHEDSDGDGSFDKHKTFVDGLNIATSCVTGRGGVWVLNPPYLLFYPDKNGDDVPDGDPVVHLEGFGLEDTHSAVNSLLWGPDGWLYSAQGSTVSGQVKHFGVKESPVHSMGQLIWRYHPESRRYEIFAEGGGNAFGVEIDAKGRIYSGYNGGNTRGFHYIQGGYYLKGFGKHGSLSNPYAFGYFQAMKHPDVPRFTHQFIRYEGASLPKRYHDHLIGVQPMLGQVTVSEVMPDRSSFQTKDTHFAVSAPSDPWFRPVNVKIGPDGAAYVADMYEAQIAHLRHHEGKIDITNGRIYRLQARDAKQPSAFDYTKLRTAQLVEVLKHPNRWHRRMANQLLGDRKDRSAIPHLLKLLDSPNGQDALEALWGIHLSGGLDEAMALRTLSHGDPHVRAWTVRLLCDGNKVSPVLAARLAELAKREPHVEARIQLACSARRLPAADGLPILLQLLQRDEDVGDIHQPLTLWWGLEARCEKDRDRLLAAFEDSAAWRSKMVQTHILHRLMRRFAATGARKDLVTCARLLKLAPDTTSSKALIKGFEEAYHGRQLTSVPAELVEALAKFGGDSVALGLRQHKAGAVTKALALIAEDKTDNNERLQLVQIFGQVKEPKCVPALIGVLTKARDDALRLTALTALQSYPDPAIGDAVLGLYGKLTDEGRSAALATLASRKGWALQLLNAIDQGKIDKATVALDVARQLTAHRDPKIAELVSKHWGKIDGATTAEMQATIAKIDSVLRAGTGNPYSGKKLFLNSCAKCHKLFADGGQVGPDLTAFQRTDIANMLVHIVNPNAEIREGFETLLVATNDGRVLTGTLVEKDNQVLILRGADGQSVTVRQDQIEEMAPQKKSLMPEGLLKDLNDQQVRDLFAYLRSTQPLP